jgi:hypothetical protein
MKPILDAGTLVHLKPTVDSGIITGEDGYLWTVIKLRPNTNSYPARAYLCKSVATGQTWTLFDDEFTTDITEDTNGQVT